MWIIIPFIIATFACYAVSEQIVEFFTQSLEQLVFTKPMEAFMVRIKVSLFAAAIISLPITLFHLWKFIAVGLKSNERKLLLKSIPAAIFLFALGASFSYFGVLPLSLPFLMSFGTATLQPMITVSAYFSFLMMMIAAFGILFEIPLFILILTKLGIVTPEILVAKRKAIIVAIFIVAAILTPPDIISQVLLAIPIIFLFEISIYLSRLSLKKNN
jgi:sec-independent protein translocase protein TatC